MLTMFLEASLTFQLQHTSHSPAVPVAHNIGAIHPDVTMVTGVIQGHPVDVPCDLRRRSPAELTREPDLRLVDVYDLGRLRGRSYPDWGFCGKNAMVRTCFQAKPLEIANPRALDAPLTSVRIFHYDALLRSLRTVMSCFVLFRNGEESFNKFWSPNPDHLRGGQPRIQLCLCKKH